MVIILPHACNSMEGVVFRAQQPDQIIPLYSKILFKRNTKILLWSTNRIEVVKIKGHERTITSTATHDFNEQNEQNQI